MILTSRQLQCVALVAKGRSSKQIAAYPWGEFHKLVGEALGVHWSATAVAGS